MISAEVLYQCTMPTHLLAAHTTGRHRNTRGSHTTLDDEDATQHINLPVSGLIPPRRCYTRHLWQ